MKDFTDFTAYSYRRFSSEKQSKGDVERQIREAKEAAAKLGAKFDPNLVIDDSAVSAYRGANLDETTGRLGAFIALAKAGKLASKPLLIIEHLDRFSRAGIDNALPIFIGLLKAGVYVHSVIDGQTYAPEDAKNMGKMIMALVYFAAAEDYSVKLSKRVSEAQQEAVVKAINGQQVCLGAHAPAWLNWDKQKSRYVLNNEVADIVKRIYREYLDGKTAYAIMMALNADHTPRLSNSKLWSAGTVLFVLRHTAAKGEYRGKQYFPALVSVDDWNKVQGMLAVNKRRAGKTSDTRPNILRGLLHCASCGGHVALSKIESKRPTKTYTQYYLRCNNWTRGGCKDGSYLKAERIERVVLFRIGKDPEALLVDNTTKDAEQFAVLQEQKLRLTKQINKLVAVNEDLEMDELKAQLTVLKTQLNTIDKALEAFQCKMALSGNPAKAVQDIKDMIFVDGKDNFIEVVTGFFSSIQAVLDNFDKRIKITSILSQLIERIDFNFRENTGVIKWKNGKVHPFMIFDE
ncbi:MAG: recombinase family protein [Limisphaerales bacterium]